MKAFITAIDHIQVAAPQGAEAAARNYYGTILGMDELEKPPVLRARGGCWFQCGGQQIHIGIENEFRPAKRAHPALRVSNFDELRSRLLSEGFEVRDSSEIPGTRRFFSDDPWGNRIEFVEA